MCSYGVAMFSYGFPIIFIHMYRNILSLVVCLGNPLMYVHCMMGGGSNITEKTAQHPNKNLPEAPAINYTYIYI